MPIFYVLGFVGAWAVDELREHYQTHKRPNGEYIQPVSNDELRYLFNHPYE